MNPTRLARPLLLALLTLIVPAVGVGCASDANVIAQANSAHDQIEPAVVTDAQLERYVQAVGDRIVAAARELATEGFEKERLYDEDPSWMFEEVKFHLVNSKTLNAFTTGGQHVYLYSELFRQSKTEDEFAAVVAHEFAHIAGRHVHSGMNRQYGIIGAGLAAAGAGYALGGENKEQLAAMLGGGAIVGGQLVGAGFGRRDEDEADRWGFAFYTRAGYDPDRFGDFFQQMIDKGFDKGQSLTASHPSLKDRVVNARQRAEAYKDENPDWERQLREDVASPRQFRQLQDRAARLAESLPNDESLAKAQLMLASFPSCVAPTASKEQVRARERMAELLTSQADPTLSDAAYEPK